MTREEAINTGESGYEDLVDVLLVSAVCLALKVAPNADVGSMVHGVGADRGGTPSVDLPLAVSAMVLLGYTNF